MKENFRPTVIRGKAWESLRGKWGMGALVCFIYGMCVGMVANVLIYVPMIVTGGFGSLMMDPVAHGSGFFDSFMQGMQELQMRIYAQPGYWLTILLVAPLAIGMSFVFLDVARGKTAEIPTMFEPFRKYWRYLGGYLLVYIFTFLWTLLFIVPGIVKSISYSMTFFVMRDYPDMGPDQARKVSMDMMNGHKWEYFCLQLSFIGWILLGLLACCGLGLLFVQPYISTAHAEFYRELKRERGYDEIAY